MSNNADFLAMLSCEQDASDDSAVTSTLQHAIAHLPLLDLVDYVPHTPGACAKRHIDVRGMAYMECTVSGVIIRYLCTHDVSVRIRSLAEIRDEYHLPRGDVTGILALSSTIEVS